MKKIFILMVLLLATMLAEAQSSKLNSLHNALQQATTDSARYNVCTDLYFYYVELNRDSALFYAEKRLTLASANRIKIAEAAALLSFGFQYSQMGRYSEAFGNLLQSLKIVEDSKTEEVSGWKVAQYPIQGSNRLILLSTVHHVLGGLMKNTENPEQEILQLKKGLQIAVQINHPDRQMTANMNLATAYLKMNHTDSALHYAKAAQFISQNYLAQYKGNNSLTLGNIYWAKGEQVEARKYYYEALRSATIQNNQADIAKINHRLVAVYHQDKNKDSVLHYAMKNLEVIESIGGSADPNTNIGTAYEDLYSAYKLFNQVDSAYKYQGLALIVKDSMYNVRIRNLANFQKLSLGEALRLESLEKDKIQTQSKIRTYGLLIGLAVLSVIGFILYRNNRQKQKANKVLEATLANLQSTQSQLIQSEKMASLGELTAGIAHEIQNPLNFVNNFSEVSNELIQELKDEKLKVNKNEALENELLNDISKNLEKINHHGKRAADIVKGMLQHSRSSSGQKELTDINALCDEYLRLSYHGLRAKDKSFNAKFETDFDSSLPKINIVPQDIGRVVLNLISNAFYTVNEKAKQNISGYEPLVTISTHYPLSSGEGRGEVLISVIDNGNGIPQNMVDKIFQPFFTTKPTGQGTGLGLSLSYDIITKGHSGEIKVETILNEGTTFIVSLPV